MNPQIELVKKWLADPESVSLEELKANREAAEAAVEAAAWAAWSAAESDYWAARAAWAELLSEAADWAVDASYWKKEAIKHVDRYEELTK